MGGKKAQAKTRIQSPRRQGEGLLVRILYEKRKGGRDSPHVDVDGKKLPRAHGRELGVEGRQKNAFDICRREEGGEMQSASLTGVPISWRRAAQRNR